MNKIKEWAIILVVLIGIVASLCIGISWKVFQWRNPTANEMSFYRDWWSVVTFQKLDKYQ